MVEFRISCEDTVEGLDLRRLALGLVESQGWPRDRVSVWDTRGGDVIVTVPEELLQTPPPDPLRAPVHTAGERHTACEVLKRHESVAASLRHVPFTELRDEAERFFLAGWTVADLLHALCFARDGSRWPTGEEYHAEGVCWLQHRLRNWRTPDGDIRPSVTQEAAALRVVHRAGLPERLGLPEEGRERGQAARGESVRAAADDARRLLRAQTRTTSNALEHRDRTAARIRREGQPPLPFSEG